MRPPGQPNPRSSPGHPRLAPGAPLGHTSRMDCPCCPSVASGLPPRASPGYPWSTFMSDPRMDCLWPPLRHPLVRPPGQPVPRLPLLTLGSDPQDRLSLYHLQGTPRASPGQKPRTACPLVTPESPPGDPQNVPGSDPQDGLSLCHPQVAPRSLPGVECPCVAPGCP